MKFIYTFIFLFVSGLALSSIQETNVSPTTNSNFPSSPIKFELFPNQKVECRTAGLNKGCLIDTPQDNNGNQCPSAGNPINLGSGNKFQKFSIELSENIDFEIFYNSYRTFNSGEDWNDITRNMLGGNSWFANVEAHISPISTWAMDPQSPYWLVRIARPDGRIITYYKSKTQGINGEWIRYQADITKKPD